MLLVKPVTVKHGFKDVVEEEQEHLTTDTHSMFFPFTIYSQLHMQIFKFMPIPNLINSLFDDWFGIYLYSSLRSFLPRRSPMER